MIRTMNIYRPDKLICLVCVICCINVRQTQTYSDVFSEELVLKPLPSGHLYAYFQFATTWDVDLRDFDHGSPHHYQLFPRAIGEIVSKFGIQEMHLTLTQGLWRHNKWGYPVQDAPPGAQLWAWFLPDTKDVDRTWKEFAWSLSGLFCASLNFVDETNSVSPEWSLKPAGLPLSNSSSSLLRFATLPREVVCTENLTPWIKLLPCDKKRGLSTLLNAAHIYNTNYHSLGIHLRPVCRTSSCEQISIELTQTVSLVFDVPVLSHGRLDWSLRSLFGNSIFTTCALAKSSIILVDLSSNETTGTFTLSPEPPTTINSLRGGQRVKYAEYDVHQMSGSLSIAAVYKKEIVYGLIPSPLIHANRYVVGHGQQRGGIVTKVYNRHPRHSIDIVLLENIPWFLRVYLHTLSIKTNNIQREPNRKTFVPGRERKRPYLLELAVTLPPWSETEISIEFDRTFLKWQEYPPDANHGFYVGSAVISAVLPVARNYTSLSQESTTFKSSLNASSSIYFVRLYTESLLVLLPTPDFSMPYNVICLACTVVALAFGPLHNITTKRLILKDSQKKKGILGHVKSFFSRRKPDQSRAVQEESREGADGDQLK